MVVHHVLFWLKNPSSIDDRNKLIEGVKTLSQIESVQFIHIGVPAPTEKRTVVDASYSVSELIFFKDSTDEIKYQVHPIHQEFIAAYGHLWDKVVVYDAIN